MNSNIKILFFSVVFLLATIPVVAAQPLSGGEESQPAQLNSDELDRETGAGFTSGLTSEELDRETAYGFRRVSPLELEMSAGRGFGSDLSYEDLEQMVGHGFINELTPDEIDRISARGNLTDEQIEMSTQSLAQLTAQGVRFVVDKSKFTTEELDEIEGRGTLSDIGRSPYSIQIGLFKDMQNALIMLEETKQKGYDPYIFRTRDDDGTPLFAVRLGDYDTIQRAYAQVTHYRGKEHREAFVTHINSLKAVQKEDVMGEDGTFDAADSGDIDFDRAYPEGDLRTLYRQIKALENEIDKLRVESDARKQLQMTEAEARQEEEEILSAAGRDYTLAQARTFSFDYSFGYSYNTYDEADWDPYGTRIKHTANHSLNNTVSARYALFDNLTLGASVPFVYKYHELGTAGSKDVSDLGDISLQTSWQPFRAGGRIPAFIMSSGLSLPTGRSPYEINPDVDLATGSGVFSASIGLTGSKKIDPAVLFGGINYSYQFEKSDLEHYISHGSRVLTKVKPGSGIGVNLGLGYAMSYKASVNAAFQAGYSLGTTYEYQDGRTHTTGTGLSASLSLGTGWRLTDQRTISVGLGIGLTNNATDFSLSFRIPYDYRI